MSNVWGKTLLEMKRVGAVIGKSAGEIGAAFGEAAVNISAHTKKVAKISIMKAEMDNLYYELGKVVFEEGLMPSNELAMIYMEELFNKADELQALEAELNDDVETCTCDCDSNCDSNCSVEDTPIDETPMDETLMDETPVDETPIEETSVASDDESEKVE